MPDWCYSQVTLLHFAHAGIIDRGDSHQPTNWSLASRHHHGLYLLAPPGRIKTRAAHFWNFLSGLLCMGNLTFRLQYLFAIINNFKIGYSTVAVAQWVRYWNSRHRVV